MLTTAWALAVFGAGAFVVYAAQAALARDWKACWACVIVLATIVLTGWVALAFNT